VATGNNRVWRWYRCDGREKGGSDDAGLFCRSNPGVRDASYRGLSAGNKQRTPLQTSLDGSPLLEKLPSRLTIPGAGWDGLWMLEGDW